MYLASLSVSETLNCHQHLKGETSPSCGDQRYSLYVRLPKYVIISVRWCDKTNNLWREFFFCTSENVHISLFSSYLLYVLRRSSSFCVCSVANTCWLVYNFFLFYNAKVPQHDPRFDLLVNDEWSKRHMVVQKFVQAGRKVIDALYMKLHASESCLTRNCFLCKPRYRGEKSQRNRILFTHVSWNCDLCAAKIELKNVTKIVKKWSVLTDQKTIFLHDLIRMWF